MKCGEVCTSVRDTVEVLQQAIDDVVATSADVEWAISIRGASGRELAYRNADRAMRTASVGKLLLLIEVARQRDAGELSGAALLRRGPELMVADSGLWQHLRVEEMSVDDLCVLVASVSDNVATNVVLDKVGLPALRALAESLGLVHTALLDYVRDHRGQRIHRPCRPVQRQNVASDGSVFAQRAGISGGVRAGEHLAGDRSGPIHGRVRVRP